MASKRKYLFDQDSDNSDDDADFVPSEDEVPNTRPPKRPRHQARHDARPAAGTQIRRKATPTKTAAQSNLSARLEAELADLADFNAPLKARVAGNTDVDELSPQRPTRKRKDEKPHEIAKTKKSKKIMASHNESNESSRAEALRDEVAQLRPWAHWVGQSGKDAAKSSRTEDDVNPWPRSHTHKYPPKQVGVQNEPWSSLPAEIRNEIYQYCINEEEKAVNVLHYPNGIPRRSVRGARPTNFSQSHWGFTQTCVAVRKEFTPWLLSKRSVRTPLATLNEYVDVFHHRDPVTGQRTGKVKSICNDGPLPGEGVEILELIREQKRSSDFHLQVNSTPLNLDLTSSQLLYELGHLDELDVFKKIKKYHKVVRPLASMRIISVSRPNECAGDESDDEIRNIRSHRMLLKLEFNDSVNDTQTWDEQVISMVKIIFGTGLGDEKGLQIQASIVGGVSRWKLRRPGTLDMS